MKYIFLHGLGQTASSWKRTIESMDCKLDNLYPDLSDWLCNKEICYDNLYKGLEEYCGSFHEKLNLCGLSLGGILALQYGIEHPEKVSSLVLIGTQYTMPKRLLQIQNMIFRVMPRALFQKTGFRKRDFIYLSKSMMDLDFQDSLKEIRCPTLIICGARDKVNQPASMKLKAQIPGAEISIIPNAGHEVNLENPVGLGEVLYAFFSKK